jgi:hypothetical protein
MAWVRVQRALNQYQPGAEIELDDALIDVLPPDIVRRIDAPSQPVVPESAAEAVAAPPQAAPQMDSLGGFVSRNRPPIAPPAGDTFTLPPGTPMRTPVVPPPSDGIHTMADKGVTSTPVPPTTTPPNAFTPPQPPKPPKE